MRLDVFTLFPQWFEWFETPATRAQRGRRRLGAAVPRPTAQTTPLSAGQVDDSPYGGGAGMVMRVDVIDAALQAAYGDAIGAAGGSSC